MGNPETNIACRIDKLIDQRQRMWEAQDKSLPSLKELNRHCRRLSMNHPCRHLPETDLVSPQSKKLFVDIDNYIRQMEFCRHREQLCASRIQSIENFRVARIHQFKSQLRALRQRWIRIWSCAALILILTQLIG